MHDAGPVASPPTGVPALRDLRVLGLILGNVHQPRSDAQTKLGGLFGALGARAQLVDVVDAELHGWRRRLNLAGALRLPLESWRQASYKNPRAFAWRSALARRAVDGLTPPADVVLQHGVLFDGSTVDGPPLVIYTDFTYRLVEREDPWRDPLTGRQRKRWLEAEHAAYRAAACVLTRSDHARRSLIEEYGVPPERAVTVGGGVNIAWPEVAAPLTSHRVLFVGHELERKGGLEVVRAFECVRRRIPDAELYLVTRHRGPAGPGVRYLTDRLTRAAITDLYRSASVFAMPSHCETWGDSLLEAMACGVPCISSWRDAIPEIVVDGETGLLVEPGDVTALAEALERLLLDEPLRRAMGVRGRERALRAFRWDQVAERILPHLWRAAHPPSRQAVRV
jgi:glycosyltransferase involved in cell wall biosynthesis